MINRKPSAVRRRRGFIQSCDGWKTAYRYLPVGWGFAGPDGTWSQAGRQEALPANPCTLVMAHGMKTALVPLSSKRQSLQQGVPS
jgi:hypothetical protein